MEGLGGSGESRGYYEGSRLWGGGRVLPKIAKHVSLEIKDFCLVGKLIRYKINHLQGLQLSVID